MTLSTERRTAVRKHYLNCNQLATSTTIQNSRMHLKPKSAIALRTADMWFVCSHCDNALPAQQNIHTNSKLKRQHLNRANGVRTTGPSMMYIPRWTRRSGNLKVSRDFSPVNPFHLRKHPLTARIHDLISDHLHGT